MRVLVIEDEHKIANTIKKGLEQENFAVDVVYDGIDGFDMASTEEYDTIVLDRMLPGMSGVEVCTQLRDKKNHTPILMLTAKSRLEDKIAGLNSGADDYLTKPFSFEELVARIRALSRRSKETINPVLKVGNLQLDSSALEVKRDGKIIPLSSKEFSLLEYLMRNEDKVLSKDKIIGHVWNYDADILPNTVEVTIRNLRKKIDMPDKNKKQLIQTVRGFGYKMTLKG